MAKYLLTKKLEFKILETWNLAGLDHIGGLPKVFTFEL